ncbi:hypothetical protein CRG98_037728, partial [Punica granatum]
MTLRAMQQQFERMNMVFGELRERLDRQDERLERLQPAPVPRARRPHRQPSVDTFDEEAYDDEEEVAFDATWGRGRGRGVKPRHFVRREHRRRDAVDHNTGSIKLVIPPFQDHITSQCPNKRTMIIMENGDNETEEEEVSDSMHPLEDASDVEHAVEGQALVIIRALHVQVREDGDE